MKKIKEVYQIQIVLKGIKPKIWRRILIQPHLSLADFHKVIQTTMGWQNAHLHQFIKNGIYYTEKMPDDFMWDEMDNVDYKDLKISDLLKKEKDTIFYEYDFGDGWEHDIILEKILPKDKNTEYPICVAGKNNCPPEDCGGAYGYIEMLEILKDPAHEEYEEYLEWLGEEFDPLYFNKEKINKMLKTKGYGVAEYF